MHAVLVGLTSSRLMSTVFVRAKGPCQLYWVVTCPIADIVHLTTRTTAVHITSPLVGLATRLTRSDTFEANILILRLRGHTYYMIVAYTPALSNGRYGSRLASQLIVTVGVLPYYLSSSHEALNISAET